MPTVVETAALDIADSIAIEDRIIERGSGFEFFNKGAPPTFLTEPVMVDSQADGGREFMRPHEALQLFSIPPAILIFGDENQSLEREMTELFARKEGVTLCWDRRVYLERTGAVPPAFIPFTPGGFKHKLSVPMFVIGTLMKDAAPSTRFYLSTMGKRLYWERREEDLSAVLTKFEELDPTIYVSKAGPQDGPQGLEANCRIGSEFIDFPTALRGIEELTSLLGLDGGVFYESLRVGFESEVSAEIVNDVAGVLEKFDSSWRWWQPEKNSYSCQEAFDLRRDIWRYPYDPAEAKVPICTIELTGRPFYVFRDFAEGNKHRLVFRPLGKFKIPEEAFAEISDLVDRPVSFANLR